jgi:ASPIC and UnbV/FG-GAP-like repeat
VASKAPAARFRPPDIPERSAPVTSFKEPGALRRSGRLGWLLLAIGVALVVVIRLAASSDSSLSTRLPHDAQARAAESMLRALGNPPEPKANLPAGQSGEVLERTVTPLPAAHTVMTRDGIRLSEAPFLRVAGTEEGKFIRIEGSWVGFKQLPLPPWYETMLPGENEYAPLASGDVNGDGWPDVAVGTAYGVFLYINLGGRFALEKIDFPQMRNWLITEVALVDLDGDGRPDLFLCAWMQSCYILWNRSGTFSVSDSTALPRGSEAAVTAVAFADFEHNGRVDIATGGSTGLEWEFYPQTAAIVLWLNEGHHRFVRRVLNGTHGETLSLLAADLSGTGWPDLYAANDFDEPDVLFLNHHGTLVAAGKSDSPFPKSTMSDMSVDSADISNDGKPAIYEDNIAYGTIPPQALDRQEVDPGTACTESYAYDASQLERCQALGEFQTAVVRSRDITNVTECKHFRAEPVEDRDCIAAGYLWNEAFAKLPTKATRPVVVAECARIPPTLSVMREVCAQALENPIDFGQSYKVLTNSTPQVTNTNLLFAPGPQGFMDATARWGVGFGGWSWNAQFADLSNDGWQDLFITQGTRLRFDNPSNLLYMNADGRRFTNATGRLGLTDNVPTGGSLFLDITMDGRLDVITYPFGLTPVVWGNDLKIAPGIQLSLRDDRSENTEGIGARVIIRSASGQMQMRDIKASGGFESQNEPVADFGLGRWPAVSSITVEWADGTRDTLSGLTLTAGRYTIERLRP